MEIHISFKDFNGVFREGALIPEQLGCPLPLRGPPRLGYCSP